MRRIGFRAAPIAAKMTSTFRPKTWHDELCCFFLLQVVRCHSCMRRHYRQLFLPPVPTPPAKRPIQAATNEQQRKRSA